MHSHFAYFPPHFNHFYSSCGSGHCASQQQPSQENELFTLCINASSARYAHRRGTIYLIFCIPAICFARSTGMKWQWVKQGMQKHTFVSMTVSLLHFTWNDHESMIMTTKINADDTRNSGRCISGSKSWERFYDLADVIHELAPFALWDRANSVRGKNQLY